MLPSGLLERWRTFPALHVFIRLLLPQRTPRANGAQREDEVLAAPVQRVSAHAVIVQRAPAASAVTIGLARACARSARRVHVEWPLDREPSTSKAFREWHRRVIDAQLLPYIVVHHDVESLIKEAALVHPDDWTSER